MGALFMCGAIANCEGWFTRPRPSARATPPVHIRASASGATTMDAPACALPDTSSEQQTQCTAAPAIRMDPSAWTHGSHTTQRRRCSTRMRPPPFRGSPSAPFGRKPSPPAPRQRHCYGRLQRHTVAPSILAPPHSPQPSPRFMEHPPPPAARLLNRTHMPWSACAHCPVAALHCPATALHCSVTALGCRQQRLTTAVCVVVQDDAPSSVPWRRCC